MSFGTLWRHSELCLWRFGCNDGTTLDNFGRFFNDFEVIWGHNFVWFFHSETDNYADTHLSTFIKNHRFLRWFLYIKLYCYVIWFVLISVYFGSSARKPGVLASKRLAKPSFERFGLMLGHGWDDFPSFWDDLGVLWSFKNICYGRRKRFETSDFA